MGSAPAWLRQVSPPASQNVFNHCQVMGLSQLHSLTGSTFTTNTRAVLTAIFILFYILTAKPTCSVFTQKRSKVQRVIAIKTIVLPNLNR